MRLEGDVGKPVGVGCGVGCGLDAPPHADKINITPIRNPAIRNPIGGIIAHPINRTKIL